MMNETAPVVFARDGAIYANSRDVAAYFEKEHRHVLRDIDNLLISLAAQNWATGMFVLRTDFHEVANKHVRSFDMNRDGFTLLAMAFTGEKALRFKLAYIRQFNAMEAELKRQESERLEAAPMVLVGLASTPREVNAWTNYMNMMRNTFGRGVAMVQYPKTPLPPVDGLEAGSGTVPLAVDGDACLRHLLRARIHSSALTVADLVAVAKHDRRTRDQLGAVGVLVDPANLKGWVAVAVDHPRLRRAFACTAWAVDLGAALLAVPGARPAPGLIEFPGQARRGVLLPWATVREALPSALSVGLAAE